MSRSTSWKRSGYVLKSLSTINGSVKCSTLVTPIHDICIGIINNCFHSIASNYVFIDCSIFNFCTIILGTCNN